MEAGVVARSAQRRRIATRPTIQEEALRSLTGLTAVGVGRAPRAKEAHARMRVALAPCRTLSLGSNRRDNSTLWALGMSRGAEQACLD